MIEFLIAIIIIGGMAGVCALLGLLADLCEWLIDN
jgi:hypothetical protein